MPGFLIKLVFKCRNKRKKIQRNGKQETKKKKKKRETMKFNVLKIKMLAMKTIPSLSIHFTFFSNFLFVVFVFC